MRFLRFTACSFVAACSAFYSVTPAAAADLPLVDSFLQPYEQPLDASKTRKIDSYAGLIPVAGVTSFETTVQFEGNARRVLFLHPTASSSTRAPAIVMLHYSGGSPEKMANLTAVSKLVHDYGIWVILPEGYRQKWSTDPVRDRNRTNDSQFIANTIDSTVAAYPVDARRIYVVGFSLGGFMAERFACEHSERVAGAAWSSATLLYTLRDACPFTNTMPVMTFHGTSDTRVKYNGSLGLDSAPETAAYFAGRNSCLPASGTDLPDTSDDKTTVHLDTFGSCNSGKPVRFYTINGGGHTWPNNDYQAGLTGRTTHDIDATSLIWDFLKNYTR